MTKHKTEDYKISAEEYGNGKSKTIQKRKHSRPWTDLL